MGGLEVVFRCHTSGCFMFFCKDLQKIMVCTHNMYLSLFCGNLTTIDFHDNLDAGQIPGGSDGDGIGVTELKE